MYRPLDIFAARESPITAHARIHINEAAYSWRKRSRSKQRQICVHSIVEADEASRTRQSVAPVEAFPDEEVGGFCMQRERRRVVSKAMERQ